MPRTKQNNPKNLKDKIEEAQKELKHPKTSQKDVTESTGRNSECIKGLKRKKIVAQSQLKKIPKSPVKNQPQIQKSSSPETSTSSKEAIHTSLSTCPSSDLCDPQDSVSSESEVGTVKDESVISDSLGQSQKAEKLKERKKSETTGSVLVQNKDGSKSALASQTSAPLDVLLKAMEPDFDTLTERKNNSLIGHCGKSVSIPVTYSDFAVAMPAVNFSLQSQRSFVPPFTPTKQFYNSMESAQQNTKSQFPNIAGTRQQDKSGFLKSYSVGPSLNLTHSTVPSGTGGLPQSQPPVVQTCQSLSATVPSSIQVPVTPGFNPVQMTTVVKLGSHVSDVSKEQKTKKQGKYVCEYCKRACAKPSVLLKHIRSHTGERPYPCVTCGFSFKTKSNLYKHKKSHAHAIKLGLVKDPGSGSLSQESDKGLATNSDAEESGESEEDGSAADLDTEISRSLTVLTDSSLPNTVTIPVSQEDSDNMLEFETVKPLVTQRGCEPMVTAGLPKVVVHPVNFSPLRADSPRAPDCAPEHATAQRQRDSQPANLRSSVTIFSSVKEADCPNFLPEAVSEDEDHNCKSPLTGTHAQLQRQQATDYSQQQQAKCLLSPRSLGSTDSGYFSRSESADQAMSPPSPFVKIISPAETDLTKLSKMTHSPVVPSVVHVATVGKPRVLSGQMRPPLETKALSLEERISKLISENEAVVDDKQLDSVKPRRTSLSRRGSIDSPKSYIFKDSFQFDLKPPVRRSSSNSDIPKSPFTPTESSKQIFLLSVPSQYPTMDSLPITRSNSVPTTPGQSAVFANVTPQAHQLRICQSFDEKIGSLNDDVFSSAPSTPGPAVHSRTLRRQKAVDVLSSNDSYALISVQSLNNHHESTITPELRSKSFEHSTERIRKLQQNKGTMYECETCRNRYRKLENFENHKKFYCSELHGPKTKLVNVREIESDVFGPGLNQSLLNRSAIITGIVEPQMIVRKRRKIKSVGDDDDQSPTETTPPCSRSFDSCNVSTNLKGQSFTQNTQSVSNSAVVAQVQCIGRTVEQQESRLSPISESQICTPNKEHGDLLREGSGTSVIRHTNSLSRPHSFETSEDRSSPADLVENELTYKGQRDAEVSSLTQSFCEGLSTSKFVSQCHDDKQNFVVVSNSCMTAQQSRLVRQKNIQVPEILVTEEPDRDHIAELAEKPAETFNWPQRSESLSKLPTEKLPPKKKRIRLAQMEHSSGESSFDSSLSRSLSRDSSLSRCSSISASFEREDPPRPDSPSKVESVGKPQQAHGSPVTGNTLGVPGTMRRATSEQISCTQSTVEISDYRSKSFDCSSITYSRPLSPVSTIMPKTTQCPPITSVPLIERRRGPLVRQMSLKIAPDPQIGVKQIVSIQRHPFGNQGSLAQPRSINVSKPPGQSLVLNYGEVVQKKQEQMVQSINLGSQTQQPQIPGLPHPWHQSSRVSVSPVQPLVCTVQGHGDIQNPPDEQKKSFVPKYQLNCLIKKIDQMQSLERMHGTQKTTPADNEIKVSKSNDAIENVNVEQPNCDALIMMPQVVQFDEILHATSGSTSVPEILITDEHTPTSLASKAIPLGNFVKRDLKPAQQIHTPLETSSVAIQLKNYIKADQTLGAKKSNLALGSLHCTQKLASTNLCPQEGTASSKRMLSPANSLDIAMEKTQKRAKDEHGIACLTVGRSLGYANSKMSEITRQRKLMLVRQFCTTDPADSPIETDVPEQLPEQTSVHQPASASEFNDQEMESRTPTSTVPTVFATRSSPGGQSSPVLEISSLKPLDKPDEHRWSPSKSQIRPTNIQGKVKLASSVSVVNTRDSHRLSFPSLKTATTFTWCFLLKRRALHVEQTDSRTSAYSSWLINPNNPNPLGLPTKVVMSLFDSKLTSKKIYYTQAKTTTLKSDILTYSPKLKDILPKVLIQKPAIAEKIGNLKPGSQQMSQTESDKDSSKSEPQRVKIFDGGYKSTEEYVYVRGRGRGKYICEECGIRCKKPSMLRKHIRTHSDIRPFHCTHCNFSFKTKGNLTKHMKSKAHSKKCLEMGVAVGVIDEQDTEDSGDQGRTEISDRQDSDGDDSDGQDEDDNDEEDEEDSQAESGLSAAPSVSASPQHLPPIQNDLAPSSLLAQMCISQNPSSASQHPPPSDSQTSETYSPSMKSPVSMVRQMSISAPCSSPTAISSTLTYPTAPAVESQASDTDSVQMMSPVSPCRQMSIDYPDFDAPRTLPVTNKGPKLGQDGASSPLSQPTCENNANVDRGTQTSSDSLQGPLHFPTVVSVEEPRVGSTTHLYSHLPLHSQQPPRSPYSMVPVGGIQLVPAGLAAYSTFVPIQAGPVQLTIPALSVIHRQSGSPLPATSPLAQSDGIQTQSLVIQDPVSSVLPCLPLSQVAGLQTLGTPHTSVQSVGLGNLSVLGLTNSTQLVPQQSIPLKATLGVQVLATSPGLQSSTASPTPIPGLQILNITLPALIPSISPLSALGSFPPTQEQPSSESVAVPAPHRTPPAPVSSASPPIATRCDFPTSATLSTKLVSQTGHISGDKRETEKSNGESSILSSSPSSNGVRGSDAPQKGSAIDEVRPWQTDDDNAASSDDEDRLVIAT